MSFTQENLSFLFICILWSFYCTTASNSIQQRRCLKPVPIDIPQCQNTFYKFTGMPNLVGQENQIDALHQLQTFKPLITYKCSKRLNFFLCSVYTPMCDVNTRYLIGPCRPLCEHVKARCAPVLRVFDFDWPENLDCSQFPVKNVVGGEMCMEGPQDPEETPLLIENSDKLVQEKSSKTTKFEPIFDADEGNHETGEKKDRGKIPDDEQLVSSWIKQFSEFQLINKKHDVKQSYMNEKASAISVMAQSLRHCAYLKKPTSYIYVNRTGRCAPLCQADILFHPDAKELSMVWTGVLTSICGTVTGLTLLGYLLHSSLYRLTERPVVYIALCQLIYSFGFVLSIGLGRETVTCGPDLDSGREVRLQEGLDNSVCALVFMVQYFFAIASSMWWSLLTVHWALQYSQCWCSLCCEPLDSADDYLITERIDSECCPQFDPLCQCLPGVPLRKEDENHLEQNQPTGTPQEQRNPNLSIFAQPSAREGESDTHPQNGNSATPVVFDKSLRSLPPSRNSETISYFTQNGKIVPKYQYLTNNASVNTAVIHHVRMNSMRGSGNYEQMSVCLAREHVLVWLTAGLLTVGVLVSRQVDADELIPVCSVGRQNTRAMGVFVVGPEVIVTTFGLIALLAGLLFGLVRRRYNHNQYRINYERVYRQNASDRNVGGREVAGVMEAQLSDNSRLLRSSPVISNGTALVCKKPTVAFERKGLKARHQQSHESRKYEVRTSIDSLERRIGLFCFLYLLPLLCVTMCDLYEYMCRDLWLRDTDHKPTASTSTLSFPPKLWKPEEVVGPNPDIFLLRIFMSLVPGFTCSLWTWSVKGCRPWTRLFHRMRCLFRKCFHLNKADEQIEKSLKFNFVPADQRRTIHRETPLYSISSHPYAVYQYRATGNSASSNGGCKKQAYGLEPCLVETTPPPNGVETQHSSATTPGYYSQAKVGSTIEPHMSDTLSEESPIPPPLPSTSRPHLPARGDPCIGASSTHVSGLLPPSGLVVQG